MERTIRTRVTGTALEVAVHAAITVSDPRRSNLLITQAHAELASALRDVLGPDSGANFHSWAVWGSREAGTTINRRDIPALRALAASTGALLAWPLGPEARAAGAAAGWAVAARALGRAAQHTIAGNRLVLDEIGRVTARYVADPAALEVLLADLAPGPTASGGQDLLAAAFVAYDRARQSRARSVRQEHAFRGNCLAVWHEHVRLQHHITNAVPRRFRRLVTRTLLDFRVGTERLDVARDLGPVDGRSWPPALEHLACVETRAVVDQLRRPGRDPASLTASAACDWTSLADRMNYVVDLFRSRHEAPWVLDPPYDPATTARLRAALGLP